MSVIEITGAATAPITSDEVVVRELTPLEIENEAALKLVVQDSAAAEAWLGQKQWTMHWQEADILYQAPRNAVPWEGGNVTRASVSRFVVAKHVNSLVPTMMSGVFYEKPPFVLRERPGTKTESRKAWTTLIGTLLDMMEFELALEPGVESQVLNGTCIFKGGCYVERKKKKRYKRKEGPKTAVLPFTGKQEVATKESNEFEVVEEMVDEWRPFFEHRPLGQVKVSPGWRFANQLHKAPWLIDTQYPTFEDLNALRQQDGYTIPDTDALKALFFPPAETTKAVGQVEQQLTNNSLVHHAEQRDKKTSANPLLTPLKLEERWDKDRVIVVLQDKLVIRNEEHKLGGIPFWSANFWNIQNAGYGMGVGRLIGTDQRIEVGSTNAALDILAMACNPEYAVSDGANIPTQPMRARLGGIRKVGPGRVQDNFSLVETPQVPTDVWRMLEASKQSSEGTTGADEAMVQGAVPGRGSSITRTATGAGGVAAASATRIQGPVGRLVNGVMIPFIFFLIDMVKEQMPVDQIQAILRDELGDDFRLDLEDFMNARLKLEVLAGVHLAAKKAMAQALPFIIQIFENQYLTEQLNKTGSIVDIQELFDMLMEMSEWKNQRKLIRKMTPDEQKMYQALNPAIAQIMGKLKEIEAKHQATAAEIDQKTEGRLAEKVTMDALQRAGDREDMLMVGHHLAGSEGDGRPH